VTTMTYTGNLVVVTCHCGIVHAIPEDLDVQAHAAKRTVYCPLGHSWIYRGKSWQAELVEARNDTSYFKTQLLSTERKLESTERSRAAYKGELTKVRKTIHAGQCPWCRRSFKRLEAHMAAKHPDMDHEAEPT
jgi:hypothetical protein